MSRPTPDDSAFQTYTKQLESFRERVIGSITKTTEFQERVRSGGHIVSTHRGRFRVEMVTSTEEETTLHGWFQYSGQDDEEGSCDVWEIVPEQDLISLLRELELSI